MVDCIDEEGETENIGEKNEFLAYAISVLFVSWEIHRDAHV